VPLEPDSQRLSRRSCACSGIDEPQFRGIGHQYLMSTLLEYPACPRRVGASLSIAMRIGGCSETKRRKKASGVVRSLPSSITSPLSESRRHKGRSSCRLCPILLSYLDALCYHPLRADPPFHIGRFRARRMFADPKGTAHLGVRPSHLIFRESPECELRRDGVLGNQDPA
jgi:hypothetical protein